MKRKLSVKRILSVIVVSWIGICAGCNESNPDGNTTPYTDLGNLDTDVSSNDAFTPPEDSVSSNEFLLDGGATLVVDNGIRLLAPDGRIVWSMADGRGPIGLTYNESFISSFGQWEFTREDEMGSELTGTPEASVEDSVVELRWSGAKSGTLRIFGDGQRVRFQLTLDQQYSGIRMPMECSPEASFHGFGTQYNATEQRGEAFRLIVSEQGIGRDEGLFIFTGDDHTTGFPMPWWLDWRGFGVLIETDRRSYMDICATDADVMAFETMDGNVAAWSVFLGPTPLEVLEQLGATIGRPAKPPEWSFGLWLGAQGGTDAIDTILAEVEAAGLPVSALWVQDWTGLRQNIGGGSGVQYRWELDAEWYPGFNELVARVKQKGMRFLVYVNPFIDPKLPNHYSEMEAAGLLVMNQEGEPHTVDALSGAAGHPDFTNPDTVEYTKAALKAIVQTHNVDGWMADFSEYNPLDSVLFDGSDPKGYHNLYPAEWQRMTREVMDEVRPDGDWVLFARAGYTGVQAVAQIHWMHDQEVDFSQTDGLPTVVTAMINTGLSGQPFVTHDIGGFSGGPREQEAFLRWTELGAFTPFMRTHEGNNKDKNWQWNTDAETTAHFLRFVRIHDALRPELVSWAKRAAEVSEPIVKHLMLLFPADPEVRGLSDQYILGDKLLVAPVVTEGADSRSVYLPEGDWFHIWTGDKYTGGQRITVAAPIGSPPVFSLGEDRPDLRAIQ
jgi:alpha-glucosidase